ncbi:M23 family peptidase, partial [Spongiactinospora gelatinilytica]
WPVTGRPRILRHFAPPAQPWLAGHRGVDLQAAPGDMIRSPGPGTVGFAGPVGGRGVVTVLHEGGLRSTYLPVRARVRRGQTVTAGDVLGVIEESGESSTGGPAHCPVSCLHWGLRSGTDYLDPLLLMGLAPVRLLPLWPPPSSSSWMRLPVGAPEPVYGHMGVDLSGVE